MTPRLFVATRNPGKQREIRALLADAACEVMFPEDRGLWERPDEAGLEDAESFEGNARRKAEYFAKLARFPTVAEDSGIEVFALGGKPGVRSKRFAFPPREDLREQDEANNRELLVRLVGAPPERRRARYRCALVFLERHDARPWVFEGQCTGRILETPTGSGGFGYDPIFFSDELGKSFGEATAEEKAAVSHRGRAFAAFAAWLAEHPL
ncbi:MAG: non-canonical purine NTP pyrophosphatase [Gemmatimonadota bacterium]|nr:non-canonical purine NTP pyrophosphatase [Gemmatimonadota bacterium]